MRSVATKQTISLDRHSTGLVLTPKEFDAIEEYDENYHYELINGVVVVNPIPGAYERGPNDLLAYFLLHHQQQHPQGSVLDCTLPQQYVRTRLSRRIADRLIWTGLGRIPQLDEDAPTIAVEFVSKRKRDRDRDYIHKKREYAKAGIKEYWIIDRFKRTMTVFKYQPKGIKEVIIQEGEIYKTPHLPGFELPVARILEAADRLAKAQ
jgi:Uma2 family endonuclease